MASAPSPHTPVAARRRRAALALPGRRRRAALAGVAVVAAALGASACGSTSPAASTSTTTTPATTAPSTTTTTVASTTSSAPAATTTTVAGNATCRYVVGIGSPNGSAGHVGYLLTITNAGTTTCTLQGYPGVSYVTGDAGTQVGAPAVRVAGSAPAVALPPGGQAQVAIEETDPYNFPTGACAITSTRGLRIYLPGETAALFVAQPGHACTNPSYTQLQTFPVEPAGAATP